MSTSRENKVSDGVITAICAIFFWIPCAAAIVWAAYMFILLLMGGVAACPPRASC